MNIETECFKKVVIVIYKEELQMEKKLNALLSDLVVEYHKLQSFHWYLKGSHFFDDHAKLESFYDEIAEAVDAVAEAMLQQKLRPESTLKGFLAKTGIHEAENEEVTSEEAYTRVLADFEYLLKEVIVVKEAAEEEKELFHLCPDGRLHRKLQQEQMDVEAGPEIIHSRGKDAL